MANQVIVTNTGNVQVALTPPPNVQVQISRAAIGTVSNVPTANFANYAANVTSSNQPNITNVGTLGNLAVSGNTTLNNLVVTGNVSIGNLVANNANYANFANVSNIANSVAGGNVVGAVGLATFATTANAVAGANVSGVVSNANYSAYAGEANLANLATFATTANSVAGANVSGEVANANYSSYANIAASANSVAVANVSGIGNIATVNLDGNSSNVLYGNGTFATISIPAGDQISNGTSNVSIPVANSNVEIYANTEHWTFANTGNLILAGGNGVIKSIANSSLDPILPNVSTMVLTPDQSYTSQALVLDPTSPGHIHLRAPGSNIDQPLANVFLGGESSSFEVGQFNGAVPNLFIHSNNNTWMFDIDGNLTLPGNTFAVNYANGTQVPLDGPVANANYANFAGTAYSVDGANVSGEVANANFASYSNIASTANSVAVANVSGIGNIATTNYDGNAGNVLYGNGGFFALPTISNVANANYANFAGEAFNVNASNITGTVANANYSAYAGEANTANLATFATTANAVAGANVSGVVANANYSAFANIANSANSVAVANVVGIGNIATVNLTGSSSNVLYGNGVFAPESQTGNANYAAYAGNVTIATQSNITSLGNLINLTISNSAANTKSAITQFVPMGSNVGTAGNPLSSLIQTDYGSQGSNANPSNWSFVKYRGNSSVPSAASNNDQVFRLSGHVYNGNTTPRATLITATAPLAANATFQTANTTWTPGTFTMVTGNPNGNTQSTTATNNQNVFQIDQYGRLLVQQASSGSGQTTIASFTAYGSNSDGSGSGATMAMNRYRGNRDGNVAIANTDVIGGFSFFGYNGSNTGIAGGISASVNTDYGTIVSGGRIPTDLTLVTSSNTIAFTTTFKGDGNVSFPNYLTYNRTFGDFYNSSTITPGAANTPAVLPLGSTGTANNCSIQSTSQLLISRVGNYNLQFSLQAVNADNGSEHDFYVWLRKNGSDVTNSATDYTVIKNGKTVAMLTFNVSSNGSDYFEIAYAVETTQITFPAYAANNFGFTHPAIPSLIVNLIPIGA